MSVSLTFYMGLGLDLGYDSDYYGVLDEHPEYSPYMFQNPDADKPGVRLIVDGMNGEYAYLIYVVDEVELEDMYDGSQAVAEIDVSKFDSMLAELEKAYPLFADEKSFDRNDVKFIRLFHCS